MKPLNTKAPNDKFIFMQKNTLTLFPLTYFTRILSLLCISVALTGCTVSNLKLPNLPFTHSDDDKALVTDYELQLLDPLCNITPEELSALPPLNAPDLWDRIRSGYALPIVVNKRVTTQLNWYAKHQDYMERVAIRGMPYFHHIVEQTEARGFPLEIALLPIVESAFDVFAYSHGRASGIWQIIPGTGTYLGLKQNWWYDGRRDLVESTNAALNYLEQLNKRFDGDWLLALAAYNSGAGNVSRAIKKNQRKNKPTDFWHLDLPKETQDYVPRLLALSLLVAAPQNYDINLPSISNTTYFAQVDVGSQIDLAHAAELAEIEMDELYQLNPGFNRWATDPSGPHTLLVPVEQELLFTEKLGQIDSKDRVTWQRHTIKNGETLSIIAKKYNLTIEALKSINDMKNNQIIAGKTLIVPVASKSASHYTQSLVQRGSKRIERSEKNAEGEKVVHVVSEGDSLWNLSMKHKVSVRQIARWNSMAPGDPIYPGKKLVIWSKTADAATAGANKQTTFSKQEVIRKLSYRVRNGDSLAKIATKFNVKINDIVGWNSLKKEKYLQPGQALTLYVDVKRN